MLTPKQIYALAELLHACRDDWDTRGIQAALRRVDTNLGWPEICWAAITAASNAGNRTPDVLHQDGQHWNFEAPRCKEHPHAGIRDSGECAGCWTDRQTPDDGAREPYLRRGVTTPPANFRDIYNQAKDSTCH